MKPVLIGLTGLKNSGKTTTSKYLADSYRLTRTSFAAPLKNMLCALFPEIDFHNLSEDQKNTPIEVLGGVTPRYLMQTLGTDWGRNKVHSDMWLRLMAKTIEGPLPCLKSLMGLRRDIFWPGSDIKAVGWVIDDIRFDNEARLIKAHGGYIFEVTREGVTRPNDTHASEQPISSNWLDGTLKLPNDQTFVSRFFKRHVPTLPRGSGKGKLGL